MENNNKKKILYILTVILVLISIGVLFFYAPVPINPGERGTYTDSNQETRYTTTQDEWINYVNSFYIAYFHIPIALSAYLSFSLVFIFSILYLRDARQKWDTYAASAAEVGLIFAGLAPVTGSVWAGAAWGHYWPPGDIRLNTSLVLFFIYLAYLLIRQAIDGPEKKARLCAVFGVIGFISVPISFLSIRLWSAAYHPTVIGPGGGGMSGSQIIIPIVLGLAAFVLMCISLTIYKADNFTLENELLSLKQQKGV